jgi:hypothetical protein
VITAGAVESSLGEVGGQQRRRVLVDRDVPGLAAFARQGDDRGFQSDGSWVCSER